MSHSVQPAISSQGLRETGFHLVRPGSVHLDGVRGKLRGQAFQLALVACPQDEVRPSSGQTTAQCRADSPSGAENDVGGRCRRSHALSGASQDLYGNSCHLFC